MNQSGRVVKLLLQKFDIPLSDLIVIYDDLDLPVGKIRIRQRGSAGGHRGVESIIDYLEGQDFPRIRVGIGRPGETSPAVDASESKVIDHVLNAFSPAEEAIIKGTIAKVAEALSCLLTGGVAIAMNRHN
jgi:PTH1 family peptidyl-tRNA hydrolase